MTKIVRAAVVERGASSPHLVEITVDGVRHDEILVRILACGVCHTDVAWANGELFPIFPVVLGHEISGVVEEVGASVSRVRIGDRVALGLSHHCGHCFFCESGRPMLCAQRTRQRARFFLQGTAIEQGYGVGGFSEATVVPETSAIPIPAGIPFEVAAIIGCATVTGLGAVLNTAAVPAGATVAILGAGGVGLNLIMGCHLVGAESIVVADPDPGRRNLATQFGATATTEPVEELLRESHPTGFEFVFESAGQVEAMELAIRITMRGGTTVLIGAPPPGAQMRIDALNIVNSQQRILGCLTGGVRPSIDFDRYFRLYQRGLLDLDRLVTAQLPLERVAEAFERTRRHEGIRTVVRMGEF